MICVFNRPSLIIKITILLKILFVGKSVVYYRITIAQFLTSVVVLLDFHAYLFRNIVNISFCGCTYTVFDPIKLSNWKPSAFTILVCKKSYNNVLLSNGWLIKKENCHTAPFASYLYASITLHNNILYILCFM